MIKDIPSFEDFFEAGTGLLDFAWDTVSSLLIDLLEAEDCGVETAELSEEYWAASKRRLTTALAMTQQGVEFILKGKIAEISPYLLLADSPDRWPSPYDGRELTFAQFKTVDAQDLIRLHDIVQEVSLPEEFVRRYNVLREKRNRISHSIDKKLQIHTSEVIETILFLHKALFPDQSWAKCRANFISSYPDATLSGGEFSRNRACREFEAVLGLLQPREVKSFFNIAKKQRRYFCPRCLAEASHHAEFEAKLAVLRPQGAKSTRLYCPVCDCEYAVVRENCPDEGCPGNVLSGDDDRACLTCGSEWGVLVLDSENDPIPT